MCYTLCWEAVRKAHASMGPAGNPLLLYFQSMTHCTPAGTNLEHTLPCWRPMICLMFWISALALTVVRLASRTFSSLPLRAPPTCHIYHGRRCCSKPTLSVY